MQVLTLFLPSLTPLIPLHAPPSTIPSFPPHAMVAGISRSPATLIAAIALSILLIWCTTTATILWKPPPIATTLEGTHYRSLSTRRALTNRNTLAPSIEFDFTPFIHGHQHHHRHHHHHQHPAEGSEIDPRYGVEKRRVPTGPNPLHH
ncbi:hypothetical protein Hdeb2414_s0004g00123561 [Helianthus debilis subsp. tardiflorus]